MNSALFLGGIVLASAGAAHAQVQFLAPPAADFAKGGYVAVERAPLSAQAADTLRRINAYRAAGATCGSRRLEPAPPLEWNEALQRAAELHVRDMGNRATVAHEGSDGSSVGERVKREGYVWGGVGENAAAGRDTVGETLDQWMRSPGHCSNLMGAGFRDVAVASVHLPGTRYRWYWIMVLAAPLR